MDTTSQLEIPFPYMGLDKAIIAMKGLPSTGKSEIASKIGRWARCQVCYIDDFLEAVSLERGCTAYSPPSSEEAERRHRLAFEALCSAARRHLHLSDSGCVVIKSRLCSTFELDLLVRMINDIYGYGCTSIIIIIVDCQIKNEFRWKSRSGLRWDGQKNVWYKAGSWKDIDLAMEDEDCLDSQAWDLHLLSSLNANPIASHRRVTRLVLDPFSDLNFSLDSISITKLPLDFIDAIAHLLVDRKCLKGLDEDQDHSVGNLALYKGAYEALQYGELRRDLLEKEMGRISRKWSRTLCNGWTSKAGSCVFKYWEVLPASCDIESRWRCWVCRVRLRSGQSAYTCHFCTLTLHKACAEKLGFDFQNHKNDLHFPSSFSSNIWIYSLGLFGRQEPRHACKSCTEGQKDFTNGCESCLFETHLKCGRLPSIINHDCHPLHFLSIQFSNNFTSCTACGGIIHKLGNYVCHICNFFYHIECVFMPGEGKHEHGGYEHVMKLLYSHDAIGPEDDHWCNFCYKDMDPQAWFYSCQDCPYYITHASGNCFGYKNMEEAMDSGNLPIQQIRDSLKQGR